jgi:hypothetical protein
MWVSPHCLFCQPRASLLCTPASAMEALEQRDGLLALCAGSHCWLLSVAWRCRSSERAVCWRGRRRLERITCQARREVITLGATGPAAPTARAHFVVGGVLRRCAVSRKKSTSRKPSNQHCPQAYFEESMQRARFLDRGREINNDLWVDAVWAQVPGRARSAPPQGGPSAPRLPEKGRPATHRRGLGVAGRVHVPWVRACRHARRVRASRTVPRCTPQVCIKMCRFDQPGPGSGVLADVRARGTWGIPRGSGERGLSGAGQTPQPARGHPPASSES